MNILFITSEAQPLIKTGGLADVAGYLPPALNNLGASVTVVVPGYTEVLERLTGYKSLLRYHVGGFALDLIETTLPDSAVRVIVVCCPSLYERDGGPYQDSNGVDWPDNAIRFGIFAKVVLAISRQRILPNQGVDLVHCNDWQTGLVPALLKLDVGSPPTLFTIHNLAYQGLFPYRDFARLELPSHMWTHEALEFHDQLSFLKGGLIFADHINTVSPNYAREIQTQAFGCGLDGLLHHRTHSLSGILNGVNTEQWNPATDQNLAQPYDSKTIADKVINKRALQELFTLPVKEDVPLFSMVTRLTHQKGIDLLLEALPLLKDCDIQFAILGSGDQQLEQRLLKCARQHTGRFSVKIAYNESWAHLAIAGADAFLMPSRFEPCGLTQLYSMRYGTVPVVHAVGGLVDTVVDASKGNLTAKRATGVQFQPDTGTALAQAIIKTVALFADKTSWKSLQNTGMKQDFSWRHSAGKYMALYKRLLRERNNGTT